MEALINNAPSTELKTIQIIVPVTKKAYTYPKQQDEFECFLSQKNQSMSALDYLDDDSELNIISSFRTAMSKSGNKDDKFCKINSYCYLVSQRTDNIQSDMILNINNESACE